MGMNDENTCLNKNKRINNDKIFSILLPQKVFSSFVRADIVSIDITNLYLTGGKHVSISTLS